MADDSQHGSGRKCAVLSDAVLSDAVLSMPGPASLEQQAPSSQYKERAASVVDSEDSASPVSVSEHDVPAQSSSDGTPQADAPRSNTGDSTERDVAMQGNEDLGSIHCSVASSLPDSKMDASTGATEPSIGDIVIPVSVYDQPVQSTSNDGLRSDIALTSTVDCSARMQICSTDTNASKPIPHSEPSDQPTHALDVVESKQSTDNDELAKTEAEPSTRHIVVVEGKRLVSTLHHDCELCS